MILKKPYAFLIKHFKILHIIMCAIYVFIAFKSSDLLQYFTEYINAGYYIKIGDVVGDYISIYLYLALFIILAINLILIVLLHIKEKNNIAYEILFVIYVVVSALIINGHLNLLSMQLEVIDFRKVHLFRDLLFTSMFAQYIAIIFVLIRGLGFNVKKFNFEQELENIEITSHDNAEFEVALNLNTNEFARKIRSKKRYLKYYFVEHKPIFTLIGVIVVLVASIIAFINIGTKVLMHKEKSVVKINDNSIYVDKSYITEYDYVGKTISKNSTYVIVSFNIKNTGTTSNNLELNRFKLLHNNMIYSPITTDEIKFFDLGEYYKDNKLKQGQEKNYILVFKLPISEKNNNNYILRYSASQIKNDNILDKNFDIKISPISSFIEQNITEAKLNQTIELNQSILGNTKITLNSYEISDSFKTEYKYCTQNNICQQLSQNIVPQDLSINRKTILKLNLKIEYDDIITSSNIKDKSNLISKLSKVYYTVDDKQYEQSNLVNLTPEEIRNDNNIYLELDSSIKDASTIKLVIDIRGYKYTYILNE